MTRSRPPAPNSAACLRGVVPLNRSGLAGRVFFPGKQVEELIGGQGIDLYSADSCGRGAHLEPNRKFVLECAGTPPPGRVARAHLSGDDACRGRGRWPRAGRLRRRNGTVIRGPAEFVVAQSPTALAA